LEQTRGAIDFFEKTVVEAVAGCDDPATRARIDQSRTRAAAALNDWQKFLTGLHRGAEGSFALGADVFVRKLAAVERVADPLPTLLARRRLSSARPRAS